MILAYPYFKKGNIYYYVYDRNKDVLSILSYNGLTNKFVAIYNRTVKDNKLTLDYRPKRITVHMNELNEVEE